MSLFFFLTSVHAVCYVHQVFYSCVWDETYPRLFSSNAHCCLEFTVGKILNPSYFYFFVCSIPHPTPVGFCLCLLDAISSWVLRMPNQFLWVSSGSWTKCCWGILFLSLFEIFPSLCVAAFYEWHHAAVLVWLLLMLLKTEIPKPSACGCSWRLCPPGHYWNPFLSLICRVSRGSFLVLLCWILMHVCFPNRME